MNRADIQRGVDATVEPLSEITRAAVWQRIEDEIVKPQPRWIPVAIFAAGAAVAATIALVIAARGASPTERIVLVVPAGEYHRAFAGGDLTVFGPGEVELDPNLDRPALRIHRGTVIVRRAPVLPPLEVTTPESSRIVRDTVVAMRVTEQSTEIASGEQSVRALVERRVHELAAPATSGGTASTASGDTASNTSGGTASNTSGDTVSGSSHDNASTTPGSSLDTASAPSGDAASIGSGTSHTPSNPSGDAAAIGSGTSPGTLSTPSHDTASNTSGSSHDRASTLSGNAPPTGSGTSHGTTSNASRGAASTGSGTSNPADDEAWAAAYVPGATRDGSSAGSAATTSNPAAAPDAAPAETLADRYARAERAIADGTLQAASDLLVAIAREDPNGRLGAAASYDLALIAWRQGKPDAALQHLDRVLGSKGEPSLHAPAERLRCRIQAAKGKPCPTRGTHP